MSRCFRATKNIARSERNVLFFLATPTYRPPPLPLVRSQNVAFFFLRTQGGRSTAKRDDRADREGDVPRASGAQITRDRGGEGQVCPVPARFLLPRARVSGSDDVLALLRAPVQAHDEAYHRHKPKVQATVCTVFRSKRESPAALLPGLARPAASGPRPVAHDPTPVFVCLLVQQYCLYPTLHCCVPPCSSLAHESMPLLTVAVSIVGGPDESDSCFRAQAHACVLGFACLLRAEKVSNVP